MGEDARPPSEDEPGAPGDGAPSPGDTAPPGDVAAGEEQPASPAPSWEPEPPPARPASSLPQGWSVGATSPVEPSTTGPEPAFEPKLQIGSVLGRTLDQFVAHPLEFASLAIPAGLISLVSVLIDLNRTGPSGQLALTIIATVAGIVFTLAMIAASDEVRAGRPIDLGASIATGLARTVTAILSAIAFFLIVFGLSVAVVLVAAIFGLATYALAFIVALIGFVAIFYIGIRFALSDAAIVLDRQGPIAALNRSWRVSRGNALRMVGLYVLIGLLTLPVGIGIGLLTFVSPDVRIGALLGAVVALVTAPISAIASTLVYGDLTGRPFDAAANPPRPVGRLVLVAALIVFGVIGAVIAIPNVGTALDRFQGQATADRGVVKFGTTANPTNPCAPRDTKTEFASSEAIYIGGYFTTTVPAGQSATESLYSNGSLIGSGDLGSTSRPSSCFSESNPVVGAPPGSYRIEVTFQGQTIATGEFTVH